MVAQLLSLSLVAFVPVVRPIPLAAVDSIARPTPAAVDSIVASTPAGAASTPHASPAPDSIVHASPAPADSIAPRIVRRFEPIEVFAPLHDAGSSETVHLIGGRALHDLPVDRLGDALALKAGVVAEGEDLHVRGGRAGEMEAMLDGVRVNEPLRGRAPEVPLLALASADLLTGGFDAEYGGALAGVLDLRTREPGRQWSAETRWATDGRRGTHFDRAEARADGPLPLGLGVLAAGEATLDDTYLPALRSESRVNVLGRTFGWRADNHVLGLLKLASRDDPRRGSLEVLASRTVEQPYDPMWQVDGWVSPCTDPDCLNGIHVSPKPIDGERYERYRAADHLVMTDERRVATLLDWARERADHRLSLSLGWLATRTVTSLGASDDERYAEDHARLPVFGSAGDGVTSPFLVYGGDDPYFHRALSQTWSARADGTWLRGTHGRIKSGLGVDYVDVAARSVDGTAIETAADAIRDWRATAPGGFAYVQGRWTYEGLILNGGLREEYYSPGARGKRLEEALGRQGRDVWSLSPRVGITYPVSVRDAFSLAYVRLQQDPPRDYLYDNRWLPTNSLPLGNPDIGPATVISYQAALKHRLGPAWALQFAVFYRDVYGEVGTRRQQVFVQVYRPYFAGVDEGHASGFEASLFGAGGETARLEAHYTYLEAWGTESREDGVRYGTTLGNRPTPLGEHALDWDRRHSLTLSAILGPGRRWSLGWVTQVGSGLPWTPAEARTFAADLTQTNTRRFDWSERSDLQLRWMPPSAGGLAVGLEVRNLFDEQTDLAASVDGYPQKAINTLYDDYAAYRTETGQGGGAFWEDPASGGAGWMPVHDPRLLAAPRAIRMTLARNW